MSDPRGSCFWGGGVGSAGAGGRVWSGSRPFLPHRGSGSSREAPVGVSQGTRVVLQLREPYSPALELRAARLCRVPGPSASPGRPLFCAPCPQVAAPPSGSPLGRVSAPRPLPQEGGVPAACTGPQYP